MTEIDVEAIHSRGLERARRIRQATLDAHTTATGMADYLAVAFQAAGDALHAEADAATEQRKRGHQSLTKDLRNTAGRLVGIAQDLLELSKMDAVEPYTPATDPVTSDLHTSAFTAAVQPELDEMRATDRERIAAYLGGETDELPPDLTPAERALVTASDDAGAEGAAQAEDAMTRQHMDAWQRGDETHVDEQADDAGAERDAQVDDLMAFGGYLPTDDAERDDGIHLSRGGPVDQYDNPSTGDRDTVMLLPDLAFVDPEPYRGGKTWTPDGGVAYTYGQLMQPVDPAHFPDHWSWSQLTTLEDCGVQYRGQRLERMPQQPQWSLIGGRTFHAVTEAFDRGAWKAGGADLLPEVHPELIKQRWRDAFAAEINTTAAETGIEMGETGENYRAAQGGKEGYTWWLVEGERMLALYVHNRKKLDKAGRAAGQLRKPLELNPIGPIFLDTERVPVIEYAYKRKLDVPTGTLTIEGVIDRAYQCSDGSLLVTDLKSGRLPNQTGQLGEYAWTLVELLGSQPTPNEITIRGNFYDARKGLFTDPIDLLTAHPHEEYVFRYGAADAARRMGVFLPHRSTFCAGCSIRWACPVGGS